MTKIILTSEIVSFPVILVILYASVCETPKQTLRDRMFSRFVASFLVTLTADIISWIIDGQSDLQIYIHISTIISLLFSYVTINLFGHYIYLHIHTTEERSPIFTRILDVYTALVSAAVIVGTFTGEVYTLENGVFSTGPGYPRYLISIFIMYTFILLFVFANHKHLERREPIVFISYSLISVIAPVVEIIIPGLTVTMPAAMVSIVLIYVMLQSKHLNESTLRENLLLERSTTDELTGLRNRRAYTTAYSTAPKDKNIGVAFIDANGLKSINDTAGHEAGDQLLLRISGLMQEVFPYRTIFRISGDEFVIMNVCDSESDWTEQTNRLKQKFAEQEYEIAALGSAWGIGSSFAQISAQAEDNMYIAKTIFHRRNPSFVSAANMFISDTPDSISPSNKTEMPLLLSEKYELEVPDEDRRNLLLAVSSDSDRGLLKSLLAPYYTVIEASTTNEALDLLESKKSSLSLSLLDIHLPQMDGFNFLTYRREHSELMRIPVIITTSEYRRETEVAYLRMGAAEFLRKPFSAETLLDRIHQTIKLVESAAALSAAEYDELTRVYTRQSFYHHADILIRRNTGSHYAVYLFDIQDFRLINRRYGEAKADEALRHLGKCLNDSSDYHTVAGRYGSDQFLYLTPYTGETAEKINDLIDKIIETGPIPNLRIKTGVYTPIDRTLTIANACDRAIAAVRSIKHRYGRQLAFFDANIQRRLNLQIQLEADMEHALADHQFQVFYQPKHDSKTGRLVGAEALLRWQHPDHGFLPPGEFIPLFEKNGFIYKADLFVWQRTCENLRRWKDMGLDIVPISVNASKVDFLQDHHLDSLDAAISQYELSRELLHIEVTESTFMEEPEEFVNLLQKYRDCGYIIELDDFGSGYSALNALSRLPVDVVKMDIVFTRCLNDERGVHVLYSCIAMAKALGLTVLCEGVETENQLELIRRTDNDIIQGYYYSGPIPEADFEEYLRKHNHS